MNGLDAYSDRLKLFVEDGLYDTTVDRELDLEPVSGDYDLPLDDPAEGQMEIAVRVYRNQLPQTPPLVDGWDIAVAAGNEDRLAGIFYDWGMLDDGTLTVALGLSEQPGLPGALIATAMLATLRAQQNHAHSPSLLLRDVSESLWQGSIGDQFGTLIYALIQPETGQVQLSAAGRIGAAIVGASGYQPIVPSRTELGDPELNVQDQVFRMQAGDFLAAVTQTSRESGRANRRRMMDRESLIVLQKNMRGSANSAVHRIRHQWADDVDSLESSHLGALVVKRTLD